METEKVDVDVMSVAVIEYEEILHHVQKTDIYLFILSGINKAIIRLWDNCWVHFQSHKKIIDKESDVSEALRMLVKSELIWAYIAYTYVRTYNWPPCALADLIGFGGYRSHRI